MRPQSIAIIGRGIIGQNLAFRLAEAGFKVTLFGPELDAHSGSRAAQAVSSVKGNVLPRSKLFSAKSCASKGFQNWLADMESASGLSIQKDFLGAIEIFWNRTQFSKRIERAYHGEPLGVRRVQIMGWQNLLNIKPWLRSVFVNQKPVGVLVLPDDGHANANEIMITLARINGRLSRVIPKAVDAISCERGNKFSISCSGLHESFDDVIIAAGAGSSEVVRRMGARLPQIDLIGGHTMHLEIQDAQNQLFLEESSSVSILGNKVAFGSSKFLKTGPTGDAERAESARHELAIKGRAWMKALVGNVPDKVNFLEGVRVRSTSREPIVGRVTMSGGAKGPLVATAMYKSGFHLADLVAKKILFALEHSDDKDVESLQ